MGTWGPDVFGSDYAQDFLEELAELPESERLAELTRVLRIAANEPASMRQHDLFAADIMAAVGIVAASLPSGGELLPDEKDELQVQGWPLSRPAPAPLMALARGALAVMGAPDSEWLTGWVRESDRIEAGHTVQWLDQLLTEVQRHGQSG